MELYTYEIAFMFPNSKIEGGGILIEMLMPEYLASTTTYMY